MSKQELVSHSSHSVIENGTTNILVQEEMSKLTKRAKKWEFTCTFCFKKFPTAQAMGGHQNAHQNERMEERRLFVKDPIGNRKRAYIRAMQGVGAESSQQGELIGENDHDSIGDRKRPYRHETRATSPRARDNNNHGLNPNTKSKKELYLLGNVGARDASEEDVVVMDLGGDGENLDLTLKL